jgi:hypothetical protein
VDHHKKLEWAQTHLDAFNKAAKAWFEGGRYGFRRNYNVDTGEQVTTLCGPTELPPDWSLMIGDVIHNMRSSLDTIAYSLVRASIYGPLEGDIERKIQFPLFKDRGKTGDRFNVFWAKYMPAVPPQAHAIIEQLQPYHGAGPTELHMLGALDDLSNVDKHRHLLLTVGITSTMNTDVRSVRGTRIISTDLSLINGPFVDGQVIARVMLDKKSSAEPEAEVRGDFAVKVAFPQPDPTIVWSVGDILQETIYVIRDRVFLPLDKLL